MQVKRLPNFMWKIDAGYKAAEAAAAERDECLARGCQRVQADGRLKGDDNMHVHAFKNVPCAVCFLIFPK